VKVIIQVCYKLLKAERISVMILSRDKKKLVVAESQDAIGMEISASSGIGGYVVATGQVLNVIDAYNDPRFNSQIDQARGFRTKSILCAPITINHEVVGVLSALNKVGPIAGDPISFDKNDECLIEYLAANAGIAIKKAQLYHQAIRSQRNSAAILSIVRARSSDESVERILSTTIEAAYDLLVPELVSVFLCDHVLQEAWICVSKDGLEGLTIPFGHGVAGTVASSGCTVRVDNAYEDQRFCQEVDQQTGFKTQSMLCMAVPGFAANSKPIAVIQLINKLNGRGFDEDDEEALHMLCEEVSVALRQKVLEISLLRYATYLRNRPDKIDDARLEESLLKEYGSVTQRFKYSSSIRTRQLNRNAATSAQKCPVSISADILLTSTENRKVLGKCYSFEDTDPFLPMYRWDLDPFSARDSDLMLYAEQMFRDFDLINHFKIDETKLRNLILSAHALYHTEVAFHNFKHGFSVMHITYLILRAGAAKLLTSLDILAALLSALCHDLDHPGNNNAFEVATRSDLALTHSNDSVLERHHSSMTHRLLHNPDSNIISHFSPQDQAEIRGLITDTIMATDMAVHFYHVERLEISAKSTTHFDFEDPNSRRILLGHIVHAADLSGQVLSTELALKWGERCVAEFIAQCAKEKELGLPVTPFMDGLTEEIKMMRLQHGFVGNIVLPLWTAMSECFPNLVHTTLQAQANYDYYSQRIMILSEQASPRPVLGAAEE
jgi:dual 3',5'-cyclic-AMP and -GMP phosphodiesterase 11